MARPLPRLLDRITDALESATVLDTIADRLAPATTVLQAPVLRGLLSGTDAAHPLHPALVAVPMGSWLAAGFLDATGGPGSRAAARRLVGFGVATAFPTALTGAADWSYTNGAERRIGVAHALGNYTALALFGGSWFARRGGRHGTGAALAAAGTVAVTAAGWLGGHLAYARGVGVDTTAFQVAPQDWVDVLPEADLPDDTPTLVHAGTVPVLLLRTGGELRAISDRCTHRGAPLHEGPLVDGCIECPWHGSRFDTVDGSVVTGPASRPQPVFQARVRYGSIQLRRHDEQVALRLNPVP